MAAAATYEPIATTTLSTTQSSVTFNSLGSYTDIKLISVVTSSTAGQDYWMQFNGITTTTYSQTILQGDGSTASSVRASNNDGIYFTWAQGMSNTIPQLYLADIFSYGGSTNKTCLLSETADRNGTGDVFRAVGLWRSTSAITSITLKATTNFASGSTFTLYGIKNSA